MTDAAASSDTFLHTVIQTQGEYELVETAPLVNPETGESVSFHLIRCSRCSAQFGVGPKSEVAATWAAIVELRPDVHCGNGVVARKGDYAKIFVRTPCKTDAGEEFFVPVTKIQCEKCTMPIEARWENVDARFGHKCPSMEELKAQGAVNMAEVVRQSAQPRPPILSGPTTPPWASKPN